MIYHLYCFQKPEYICNHDLNSLKVIEPHQYCRMGGELCHTTCKDKDCKHIFVSKETRNSLVDSSKIEYIPNIRIFVKACFNVNYCDYALCCDCYCSTR